MELYILLLTLWAQSFLSSFTGALPKFNVVTGRNCWLPTDTTKTISAWSETTCSIMSTVLGLDSFNFENSTCTALEATVPKSNVTIYSQYGNNIPVEIGEIKPVTGSNQYGSFTPDYAVDGDKTTFFHSDGADYPWVLVDLTMGYLVSQIRIMPRIFPSTNHIFRDVQVLLGKEAPPGDGEFDDFTVVGTIDGPAPNNTWQIFDVVPPECSRYVAVYKYKTGAGMENLMELAEVHVFTVY